MQKPRYTISISVTEIEYKAIKALALRQDISVTTLMRRAIGTLSAAPPAGRKG